MLRKIDIPKLVLQLLRPNYSITNGYTDAAGTYHAPVLNKLYRFILCLLYPLKPHLDEWDSMRQKAYAIASCQYGRKQVLAILNKYYSSYGPISLGSINTSSVYLYNTTDNIPVLFYCWKSNTANTYIYTQQLSWEGEASYYQAPGGAMTLDKNQLTQAGNITLANVQASYTAQPANNVTDLLYLYEEGASANPVYLCEEGAFSTQGDVIYIPQALKESDQYDDFVADLNAMILYGASITINTINNE